MGNVEVSLCVPFPEGFTEEELLQIHNMLYGAKRHKKILWGQAEDYSHIIPFVHFLDWLILGHEFNECEMQHT